MQTAMMQGGVGGDISAIVRLETKVDEGFKRLAVEREDGARLLEEVEELRAQVAQHKRERTSLRQVVVAMQDAREVSRDRAKANGNERAAEIRGAELDVLASVLTAIDTIGPIVQHAATAGGVQ